MKKTRGDVVLGGSVAYVPQQPWIVNASVKQNIMFGETEDNARFVMLDAACNYI